MRQGLDGDSLCESVGIDPRDMRDADGRIDLALYQALWLEVMARVGDPAFPFEVAKNGGDSHNFLRFICMTSQDVREALRRANRYVAITSDMVSWPLEERDDVVVIGIERDGPWPEDRRVLDEFSCAEIVQMGRATGCVRGGDRDYRADSHYCPNERTFFAMSIAFSLSECLLASEPRGEECGPEPMT